MASSGPGSSPTTAAQTPQGNYLVPLVLMLLLYFGIGFITALNDVLVPHFKDLFHLTNFTALLVQFAFFGAYFLLSLPSGWIVGRIGYKAGIIAALSTMGVGLLLFLPASYFIRYGFFLAALFVVGSGLALLQVAINPYIGALGRPETAASRLNLAGGFNSFAGTIAPRVGAAFIFIAPGASAVALARSVRAPYVTLAILAFALAFATSLVPLPQVLGTQTSGSGSMKRVLRFSHLRYGALAIFTYVGAEVAIGSLLINYLAQPSMGSMSHMQAARYVSLYWGGAMVARFIGAAVLQRVRQATALTFVAICAVAAISLSILGHGHLALWAIVSCGLFNSIMWPCIFPMSLEGLGALSSSGSGVLVTMVVGGAIIPEVQGLLADHFGYARSLFVVLACYLYVLFFALYGHRVRALPEADPIPAVVL